MMLGSDRNLYARINASVICNHCPHLRGWAGLMCRAVTLWVPPQCRINAGLVILRKYTPIEFTIIKSRAMTLCRSPQCRAFSSAVMDEKSPLFPMVGEVGGMRLVVTNDRCITCLKVHDPVSTSSLMRRLTGLKSASSMESNKCHF